MHKIHGSTIDYAVIYLGPKVVEQEQAYAALSRVRPLNGIRIEHLNCEKLTVQFLYVLANKIVLFNAIFKHCSI